MWRTVRSNVDFLNGILMQFTEYDIARNSQVLHWNFSIPRSTSYSVNNHATASTPINDYHFHFHPVHRCQPNSRTRIDYHHHFSSSISAKLGTYSETATRSSCVRNVFTVDPDLTWGWLGSTTFCLRDFGWTHKFTRGTCAEIKGTWRSQYRTFWRIHLKNVKVVFVMNTDICETYIMCPINMSQLDVFMPNSACIENSAGSIWVIFQLLPGSNRFTVCWFAQKYQYRQRLELSDYGIEEGNY